MKRWLESKVEEEEHRIEHYNSNFSCNVIQKGELLIPSAEDFLIARKKHY